MTLTCFRFNLWTSWTMHIMCTHMRLEGVSWPMYLAGKTCTLNLANMDPPVDKNVASPTRGASPGPPGKGSSWTSPWMGLERTRPHCRESGKAAATTRRGWRE